MAITSSFNRVMTAVPVPPHTDPKALRPQNPYVGHTERPGAVVLALGPVSRT